MEPSPAVMAGLAARRIDIQPGTPMGGYAARSKPSKGTHDQLHARVLAVRVGDATMVVVSCDLVGLEKHAVACVKDRIARKHGIPESNVIIAATHTHSGPRNIAIFGEPFKGHEIVYETIEAAVDEAITSMQPASVSWVRERVHGVGFNRRVYDPTSEHVDDWCTVLVIKDVGGHVTGVVYHFACHPVVMGAENLEISADWVCFANRHVEAAFPGAIPVFLQGASGNINPVNTPIVGTVPKHTFDDCDEIGATVGKAVVDMVARVTLARLDVPRGTIIDVAIDADDVDKEDIFTFADGSTTGDTYTVHTVVQAIASGEIAMVGVPGELFSEISMRVKGRSPFPATMVLGHANDYIGYIPTRENYLAGGYETSMMSLHENEGSIIEEAAIEALRRAG